MLSLTEEETCWGGNFTENGLNSSGANFIRCVTFCEDQEDCYENYQRNLRNDCWYLKDGTPAQVCTEPGYCVTWNQKEAQCLKWTTEAIAYDEDCIGSATSEITPLWPKSFSSCINYCSQLDRYCTYLSFNDHICNVESNCTKWDGILGSLYLFSLNPWISAEKCYNDSDTIIYCTGGEDYLRRCLHRCEGDTDCKALLVNYSEEVQLTWTSNCSNVSLALSNATLYVKGDLLDLFDYNSNGDQPNYIHTNVITKLLYVTLIIMLAFCIFHFIARAAAHYNWTREQLINAVTIVHDANRQSSMRQAINPEDIWNYLKDINIPESGSEECCSICLEVMEKEGAQLPCGHIFHRECIQKWLLNTKKECAICRSKVYASPPPGPIPYDDIVSGSSIENSAYELQSHL